MNRKQRRATQKQSQVGDLRPGAASDRIAALQERALHHLNRREFVAAAQALKKILALNPNYAIAHDGLGQVYFAQGKLADASQEFARAAVIAPQALDQFLQVVAKLVALKPVLGDALKKASAAGAGILRPEELLGPAGLAAIADDAYFRVVLESTVVRELAMERLLTSLRAAFLTAAADPPRTYEDPDSLAFAAALAQQCFINEFVFAVSAPEAADLERLKAMLADAVARSLPVHPLRPLALAMYVALDELPEAEALAARAWPAPVAAVMTQQVLEPREERRLRELIPRLTPIGDGVTANVRLQYEENPYPRWVRLVDPPQPILLDEHIRHHFPAAPFRPLGERDAARHSGGRLRHRAARARARAILSRRARPRRRSQSRQPRQRQAPHSAAAFRQG